MEEIWKDVVGYEGLYKISNLGRCYCERRKVFLKSYNNGNGYMFFPFNVNNKAKQFYVHRLIAIHFLTIDNERPFVNHINGNKSDNRIENLEWCTNSENLLHSYRVLKLNNSCKGVPLVKNFKKVILLNENDEPIKEFVNLREAAKCLNINYSNLSSCIHGKRKTKLNIRYENKPT